MAVLVDITNKKSQQLVSTSVTIAAGDNLLVLTYAGINDDIATAVFNSVSLTQLGANINNGSRHQSIWYMVNPPVGTFTLAITTTNTFANMCGIIPYSGVNTSAPFGTLVSANSVINNNPAVIASGAATGDLYQCAAFNANTSQTSGGSQTSIIATQYNGTDAYSIDTLPGSGSGSFTFTGSGTGGSNNWASYAVPILASGGAAPVIITTRQPDLLLGSRILGPLGLAGFLLKTTPKAATLPAPGFSGPIPNQSNVANTGSFVLSTAPFFSGVTLGYTIAPAPDTGITFNTSTGDLTTNTATASVAAHGPYTITATNANGSTASNAFTDTVTAGPAPVFSGPIPNQTYTQNTGTQTLDTSTFFTGVTAGYTIAPAPDTGITFNTGTGLLSTNTATTALGAHGPYTVTASNANGPTSSNAFTVTDVAPGVQGPYIKAKMDFSFLGFGPNS